MRETLPGWLRGLSRRWKNPDLAVIERSLSRGSDLAVLQPWTTTAEDRYPQLFDRLATLLAPIEAPRVLSFGCAGGEEVRALRRRLPRATLVGVDVNPRALDRARRADRDPKSRYLIGDRPPPSEAFDAVLALSVFRHGRLGVERPASCSAILPSATVAAAFSALDASLAPGGWLAWGHAHFHLRDLPGGGQYELVEASADFEPMDVAFGPDDRQAPVDPVGGGIYRKRG